MACTLFFEDLRLRIRIDDSIISGFDGCIDTMMIVALMDMHVLYLYHDDDRLDG